MGVTGLQLILVLIGLVAGFGAAVAAGAYARRRLHSAAGPDTPFTLVISGAGGVAALAAGLAGPADPAWLWLTFIFGWLLLTLAAIDLLTFLLPDALNLAVFLAGCFMVAWLRQDAWAWHVAGALAGYGLLWIVETGYRRLRGVDGLGRGDAKLLGAIGMWVSVENLPPVLLVASLCGILAVLAQAAMRREKVSGQSMTAFGPWIALGGYAVWVATA